jgi:RNA polymerase sigma-54 factor
LGIAIAAAESVLTKLQTLEPTGIFARSLAECLKLQAQDAGQYDGPMAGILANLGLLAAGDTARLARLCNCTEAEVIARFGLIRAMNPKPGSDFLPNSAAALREPDLLARPLKSGRWSVTLNRSGLPDLEVVVKPGNGMAVDRAGLSAARALRFALRARNTTLLRVGREIAGRQLAALIQGPGALLPMTMADVATALSLHESTISRVVAGASLDGPRGVWWLRQMFSGARGGGGGTGPEAAGPQMAAAALRHRIARMIADERPEFPMSDKALTEQLALDTGIIIARRTVAKYRETQGIPPAHRRRRG